MSIQRGAALSATAESSEQILLFKAIADPYRLRILGTLARAAEPVCVCDFTAQLPLNQPAVSHHLRILRDAHLVTWERRGTWVYYRLAEDASNRIESATLSIFQGSIF